MPAWKKIAALLATMTAAELEDFVAKICDISGDYGEMLELDQMRQTLIALHERNTK